MRLWKKRTLDSTRSKTPKMPSMRKPILEPTNTQTKQKQGKIMNLNHFMLITFGIAGIIDISQGNITQSATDFALLTIFIQLAEHQDKKDNFKVINTNEEKP